LGIISLSKTYGDLRLNRACKRAIYYDNCTYRMIKNILSNNMDQVDDNDDDMAMTLPEHENIRGKNYYMEDLQ
jgi:hypothetical protein